MYSAISLLVLASAVAINAQDACAPIISEGVVPTSHPVYVEPAVMTPGLADWQIAIPSVAECVDGESGIEALMCDADVAPSGSFIDFYNLKVHRNGNLQGYGKVHLTVYCNVKSA